MTPSYCVTNSVTINYRYVVSSNQCPVNKVACASVSQIVKPLLFISKCASTDITRVGKSFYYNITLTNTTTFLILFSIFSLYSFYFYEAFTRSKSAPALIKRGRSTIRTIPANSLRFCRREFIII